MSQASEPTLTVVVLNYNHARYLPTALDALLAQSYQPKEIIVMDDCSTDNSIEVIEEYSVRHPHIRLNRNAQNVGVIANINRSIEIATGGYIYLGAADDFVLPGFLETAMGALAQTPAGICSGDMLLVDEQGNPKQEVHPTPLQQTTYLNPRGVRALLMQAPEYIFGGTTIWNREALRELGGHDSDLGFTADWFAGTVLALKFGAWHIPVPVLANRVQAETFSQRSASNTDLLLRIYQRTLDRMVSSGVAQLFPREYVALWANHRFSQIANQIYQEERRARKEYIQSVEHPSLIGKVRWRLRIDRARRQMNASVAEERIRVREILDKKAVNNFPEPQ